MTIEAFSEHGLMVSVLAGLADGPPNVPHTLTAPPVSPFTSATRILLKCFSGCKSSPHRRRNRSHNGASVQRQPDHTATAAYTWPSRELILMR